MLPSACLRTENNKWEHCKPAVLHWGQKLCHFTFKSLLQQQQQLAAFASLCLPTELHLIEPLSAGASTFFPLSSPTVSQTAECLTLYRAGAVPILSVIYTVCLIATRGIGRFHSASLCKRMLISPTMKCVFPIVWLLALILLTENCRRVKEQLFDLSRNLGEILVDRLDVHKWAQTQRLYKIAAALQWLC